MEIGKLSKKGQIVIPKDIRNKLRLNYGDHLAFMIKGKKIIIQKVEEELNEILRSSDKFPKSALKFQNDLRDEWEDKS